jgi:hypothetical protein
MNFHIYAFGSICRGEIDPASDIDLLACVDTANKMFDPDKFSIYSYDKIRDLWYEGNPFAWHLYLESKLLFSADGSDFIVDLGCPSDYKKCFEDCNRFYMLFLESQYSLDSSNNSAIFHLSCMFLAARNFAACYSLGSGHPVFSRSSPLIIERKVPISMADFNLYERARLLSTRGYGEVLTDSQVERAKAVAPIFVEWMSELLEEGVCDERI